MPSIYDWSLNPDNNDRADSDIDWREGQKPSSINDSARQMMARIREYITDTGGQINNVFTIKTTPPEEEGGEETHTTTITLTSQSDIQQYHFGMLFRFKASSTNKGPTFIRVGNLDPIQVKSVATAGTGVLTGGEIQEGCIYEIVYYSDRLEGGQLHSDFWYLLNPTLIDCPVRVSVRLIPPGVIAPFAMQAVPHDWLICNGQAVSRETYKELLDAIGLVWGIGDGATTFNIPDLRGMFLRGFDGGRDIDRNRQFATSQGETFRQIMKTRLKCPESPTSTQAEGKWPEWDVDGYLLLLATPSDARAVSFHSTVDVSLDEWLDTFRRVRYVEDAHKCRVRRKGWDDRRMSWSCMMNFFRAALIFSGYFGEKIAPRRPEYIPKASLKLPFRSQTAAFAHLGGASWAITRRQWGAYFARQILAGAASLDDPYPEEEVRRELSIGGDGEPDMKETKEDWEWAVHNMRPHLDPPTVPMIPWHEAEVTPYNVPVNMSIVYAIKT